MLVDDRQRGSGSALPFRGLRAEKRQTLAAVARSPSADELVRDTMGRSARVRTSLARGEGHPIRRRPPFPQLERPVGGLPRALGVPWAKAVRPPAATSAQSAEPDGGNQRSALPLRAIVRLGANGVNRPRRGVTGLTRRTLLAVHGPSGSPRSTVRAERTGRSRNGGAPLPRRVVSIARPRTTGRVGRFSGPGPWERRVGTSMDSS